MCDGGMKECNKGSSCSTLTCTGLTAAVRRISERAQQQWHVIMLSRICNFKSDRNVRIKARQTRGSKIASGFKYQAIRARGEWLIRRQEITDAAILIGRSPGQLQPC